MLILALVLQGVLRQMAVEACKHFGSYENPATVVTGKVMLVYF